MRVESLCAHLCGWAVDEELFFLAAAFDDHFSLAGRRGVNLIVMLLLHSLCHVSTGSANVMKCTTEQ